MANQPPPIPISGLNGSSERILAGETVFAFVKANRAKTLSGRALIVYDDGTNDLAQLGDFTSGSAYALETWFPASEPFRATMDGWIVSVMIQQSGRDTTTIQRGEIWVNVQVGADASTGRAVCWGWVYSKGGFLSLITREFEGGPTWPNGGGSTADVNFTVTETVLGTFISDIVPGNGNEMIVESALVIGTNAAATLTLSKATAGGGAQIHGDWVLLGAAVNTRASLPQSTTNSTTSTTLHDTSHFLSRLISGTQSFRIVAGASAASTDVYQVLVHVRFKGALPIVTNTGTATYTVTGGSTTFSVKG